MWRYKLITAADPFVCNAPCRIKRIILYCAGDATAKIYDEKDATHTTGKRVWTLNSTAAIPKDEIDFGIQGAFFHEGCHVQWATGEVLVVYKN